MLPLLSRLPEGLNTEIGEGGVALSAGERQRVLLGRAFVAKPRVLVLDEATANLDYRTEASVKDALAVLSRGRTTILIAHRRSMLTDVDRVMVLRDGRIEQQGTPAELLRRPGYFHDMMRQPETPDRASRCQRVTPLSKPLWTGSDVCLVTGLAMFVLALLP